MTPLIAPNLPAMYVSEAFDFGGNESAYRECPSQTSLQKVPQEKSRQRSKMPVCDRGRSKRLREVEFRFDLGHEKCPSLQKSARSGVKMRRLGTFRACSTRRQQPVLPKTAFVDRFLAN